MNSLAHASFEDLVEFHARPTAPSPTGDADEQARWDVVLRALTERLLLEATDAEGLRALQIGALRPLEDDLARTGSRLVERPSDIYRLVLIALDEYQSHPRR